MKKTYLHFLRIIIFYLILFSFSRFIFILINKNLDTTFTCGKAFPAFLHGMRMDLSVVAYTFLPAFLLTLIYLFRPARGIMKAEYYYHLFILLSFFDYAACKYSIVSLLEQPAEFSCTLLPEGFFRYIIIIYIRSIYNYHFTLDTIYRCTLLSFQKICISDFYNRFMEVN